MRKVLTRRLRVRVWLSGGACWGFILPSGQQNENDDANDDDDDDDDDEEENR